MIEAVLFDLDGTFADTAPDLGAALNHVRALHRLPPLPAEQIRLQASHGSPGLLKLGFGVTPDDPRFDALRQPFLAHYADHLSTNTRLFPGMPELLDILEQQGLRWGIVTNKPQRYTLPLMTALGYATRAACLVSGDTCSQAKPHPMPLLHAAGLLGVAARNCIYLGDDKRDMEAAHAAGMPGYIALWGYLDPAADLDAWPAQGRLRQPAELLAYL